MKRHAVGLVALLLAVMLVGSGTASAHSPRLAVLRAKVVNGVQVGGGDVKVFVKIKVENLANRDRDIRCRYIVGVANVGTFGRGSGRKVIPANGTRTITSSTVVADPGNVEVLAEAHCHAK